MPVTRETLATRVDTDDQLREIVEWLRTHRVTVQLFANAQTYCNNLAYLLAKTDKQFFRAFQPGDKNPENYAYCVYMGELVTRDTVYVNQGELGVDAILLLIQETYNISQRSAY